MYFLHKKLSQQIGFKSVSIIDCSDTLIVVHTKEYEYDVIRQELFE